MKIRVFAFTALVFLLSNFSTFGVADSATKNVKRAKANQLVALLPAVDGVATFDVKRFFNEALPTLLASNQPMLASIMNKIDEMQKTTGIDVRQFDLVAAGMSTVRVENGKFDGEAVMIARGDVTSSTLVALAKKASDNKYKEESVAGKTMYLFAAKALVADKLPANGQNKDEKLSKAAITVPKEMALAAIDPNTIAVGHVSKVREALEGRTRVSTEITELLNKKGFAAMNMATKVPAGMKSFIPLDNDELGKSIDSIRYVFGSMDISAGQMLMSMNARTQQIAQAKELYETLDVMKAFGKMALGASKRPDQQLYARLIENVQFARVGTEVSMDLTVPQADLDQLVSTLMKKK
jgi:hypothetical protein